MKKVILIGSSSDIAKSLVFDNNHEYDFVELSSNSNSFNVLDKTSFPNHDNVDGLVYFPGTINLKPFEMLKHSDFEKDFSINVIGFINALQFYKKSFNTNASIVAISTVATKLGMKYHASISASKSAIEGLCISLASEFAPKIRVNCIAPSIIETKLSSKILRNEKAIENIKEKHPLNRIGTTTDVSNSIKFLLSNQSNWITGQVLRVDGGLSTVQK